MKVGFNLEINSTIVLMFIIFLGVLLIPGKKLHFFESLVKRFFSVFH